MSALYRLLEARERTRRQLENDFLRLDWAMSELGFLVAPFPEPPLEPSARVRQWWPFGRRP